MSGSAGRTRPGAPEPTTQIFVKDLQGKTLTSYNSIRTDLQNAGANVVDQEVAEDGNLITLADMIGPGKLIFATQCAIRLQTCYRRKLHRRRIPDERIRRRHRIDHDIGDEHGPAMFDGIELERFDEVVHFGAEGQPALHQAPIDRALLPCRINEASVFRLGSELLLAADDVHHVPAE